MLRRWGHTNNARTRGATLSYSDRDERWHAHEQLILAAQIEQATGAAPQYNRSSPMQPLLEEILRHTDVGERVALCTVVGSRGSTPQEKGAKMLVLPDGRTVGTLGGGCVEAEGRKVAIELLQRDESKLMEFSLDHDYGWDDGLICGGVMEIFIQTIDGARSSMFRELLSAAKENRTGLLKIEYEQAGVSKHYLEELGPPPTLVIAGAGHVGQALADIAAKLDFRVTVIDDRADYASAERFPAATRRIIGDIE